MIFMSLPIRVKVSVSVRQRLRAQFHLSLMNYCLIFSTLSLTLNPLTPKLHSFQTTFSICMPTMHHGRCAFVWSEVVLVSHSTSVAATVVSVTHLSMHGALGYTS